MAGHSKWANIKHRKARVDAKRGKAWSKCARAIMAAAKQGGGNPDANLALRYAVDEAKAANMPKDTIEKAIAKATGELGGEAYEQVIYEGYAAGGVAVMLDVLTDNRNRTVPEVRKLFEKHGGNLGPNGCVAYNFQSKGQIFIAGEGTDEESLMEAALEAGAEDVAEEGGEEGGDGEGEEQGGGWLVTTQPTDYLPVREALQAAGFAVESAELTMVPDTTVAVTGADVQRVLTLLEALEDHDDVQKVHANADIAEEELAATG